MTPFIQDADLTIYVGDALDVLRTLPDGSVDAIVTSPPYADARPEVRSADLCGFAEWIAPTLAELYRVLTNDGGFMLNLGRLFRGGEESWYIDETLAQARAIGWKRIDTIVWRKTNANGLGGEYLHNQHEYVYWLAKHGGAFRGYDAETRRPYPLTTLERYQRPFHASAKGHERRERGREPHPDGARPASVYECSVGHEKGNEHPSPMPEQLATHLVRLCCPVGGIVIDPFLGSGTTALVARKHGRRCVGIELNPKYARLAAERCQQLSLLAEAPT